MGAASAAGSTPARRRATKEIATRARSWRPSSATAGRRRRRSSAETGRRRFVRSREARPGSAGSPARRLAIAHSTAVSTSARSRATHRRDRPLHAHSRPKSSPAARVVSTPLRISPHAQLAPTPYRLATASARSRTLAATTRVNPSATQEIALRAPCLSHAHVAAGSRRRVSDARRPPRAPRATCCATARVKRCARAGDTSATASAARSLRWGRARARSGDRSRWRRWVSARSAAGFTSVISCAGSR